MKLWELSEDLTELDNEISTINDDENIADEEKEKLLNDLLEQYLDSESNFNEKAVNVAQYIKHLENLAELRKAEIKRLTALKNQADNQAKRLRDYLISHMMRTGKKKIEGVSCKLSLRKKPPQLELNCEVEDLPQEYQRITIEPDKTAIKKFIKEHGNKDWARLTDNDEYSLTIK